MKCLRSDNGLGFVNSEVAAILEKHGIRHQRTVPFTPEQNGSAERDIRTIVEAARTMLIAKSLPKSLWAEAVNTAVFVLNRTGNSSVLNESPFKVWFGKTPSIDSLHVFGSNAYVHVPKEKRRKWDSKSIDGVFVGYSENTKGYRIWYKNVGKVVVACDVVFEKPSAGSISENCDSDPFENNDYISEVRDSNNDADNRDRETSNSSRDSGNTAAGGQEESSNTSERDRSEPCNSNRDSGSSSADGGSMQVDHDDDDVFEPNRVLRDRSELHRGRFNNYSR